MAPMLNNRLKAKGYLEKIVPSIHRNFFIYSEILLRNTTQNEPLNIDANSKVNPIIQRSSRENLLDLCSQNRQEPPRPVYTASDEFVHITDSFIIHIIIWLVSPPLGIQPCRHVLGAVHFCVDPDHQRQATGRLVVAVFIGWMWY